MPANGFGPSTNRPPAAIFDFHRYLHLRSHGRNFIKTLHMNSSQCLDVSARKRFWCVNKYGQTAAIFTQHCNNLVIASPPRSLVRFFLNLPEVFPLWSSCAPRKMVPVCRQKWPPAAILLMNSSHCLDVSA